MVEVVVKNEEYHKYKYVIQIQWTDSFGLKYSYNEMEIAKGIFKRRTDFVLNRIKKNFNGNWVYFKNGFYFINEEDANRAKDWIESIMVMNSLKDKEKIND